MLTAYAAPAQAYVPPGAFIVAKMAEKRAALGLGDLEATLQTELPSAPGAEYEDKLYLKRSGRLRWVRATSDGDAITIYRDGQRTSATPAGEVSVERQDFEPLVELIAPRAQGNEAVKGEYLSACQKLGIDTSHVALARFASRIAFVIGAKPQELDKPSLWVDKDNFMPMRVIFKGTLNDKPGMWDVQFREFGSREGGDALPRVIERYFDGALLTHSEVVKVQSNVRLSDNLFLPPQARRPR